MNTAILGWGSLVWDQRELRTTGEWNTDGPLLPIEFARISNGNRVTLVIKSDAGYVPTLYALSPIQDLAGVRENLRMREGTENIENIGFIDFVNETSVVRESNRFILDILSRWNESKGFDSIVWSDFSVRFFDILGMPFNITNVLAFINALPEIEKRDALHYIRMAPRQINTTLRSSIEERFVD